MKLNININTDNYCNILVEDKSIYQDEMSTSISSNRLKFSDTISIVTIIHSDTREDKLKYFHISDHKSSKFKVPINFDGVFTVTYTVIPTKKWYDRILKSVSKEKLVEAFGGKICIYDGQYIIEIKQTSDDYIPISDFIDSGYQDNKSVSAYNKQLLSICKLRKCYVNLCQQIFENKNFSPCWSKNKVDSELIYKRDLVWMAINVITYLWKLGHNNEEIQRLLTQINSCNGLCQPYLVSNSEGNSNGCGCSSK